MDDARVDVQRDECGCGEIQLMDVEPLGILNWNFESAVSIER